MAMEGSKTPSGARIPEFDQMIFRTRNDEAFSRMPVNCLNIPAVARERTLHSAFVEIPDAEGTVIRGSDKLGVGRSKAESIKIRDDLNWGGKG